MTILQTEAETTAFTTNFSVVPIELSRRKTPQCGYAEGRDSTVRMGADLRPYVASATGNQMGVTSREQIRNIVFHNRALAG
jgi:hypothetical protein